MSPAVEFFQQEFPKESVYLVAPGASVAVVDTKINVAEWILADKLLDRVVFLMFEPPVCDSSDI